MAQLTLDGEPTDEGRTRPSTLVTCYRCGEVMLRSEKFDHPHSLTRPDDSSHHAMEPGEDPREEEDDGPRADWPDPVGEWYDITLSYNVDYRFKLPAINERQAEELAKEWATDARPADQFHVHTDTTNRGEVDPEELPEDFDPYGGERLWEVLRDDE